VSPSRRHLVAIVTVIACVLAAAGCVSVPTSGPIDKVEGPQPGCNCVNVEVKPPGPNDEPMKIVEGYLRATSNYQPNYSVAKQFLTQAAAEKWTPEAGVWIYSGEPKQMGKNTVVLKGQLIGSLAPDRAYTANDQGLNFTFTLVQEHDEWRIKNPPPKLMVEQYSFTSFYQPYDRYFIGNDSTLVPDPIYLPALRNPANIASALMKALLNGPSRWLKPAVSTAIPPNTNLSVDSVTITNGIAEVSLSDAVMALPDRQRGLLAAQIVYTLRQIAGVNGVLIKANQQPFRVPGSDPHSLVVSLDTIPQDMDPVPFVAGEQPYAVQDGKVKRVTGTSDSPTLEDPTGSLANQPYQVDALAISMANTEAALTTNSRTTLRRAHLASQEPANTLLTRKAELLRPQITKYGEIWDIGKEGGKQRMWRFGNDKMPLKANLPGLQSGDVTAFKISPDGSRMALVRQIDSGRSQLGLARISRSDKITVDGWLPLNTTQSNGLSIDKIRDVAWLDATELLVLGAKAADTAFAPVRVVQDASQITPQGEPENWNAVGLAVSPRRPIAIIIGQNGQTWRDTGNQWVPFLNRVSAVAYPG
jgi:lipoprotein LpqB-like beta-propeller protein/sporulation and spore germination protein